jgi:hypothetical protein
MNQLALWRSDAGEDLRTGRTVTPIAMEPPPQPAESSIQVQEISELGRAFLRTMQAKAGVS